MDLTKILSISGVPGLFKFVAQGKSGVIVESLTDGHRTMVSGTAKVSALGDIAIFTDSKEIPLAELFQSMYDKTGKPAAVTAKSSPDELKAFMAEILPDYDRDRVHNSDIKKVAAWYNALLQAGITEFKAEEAGEDVADNMETTNAKTEGTEAPVKKAPAKKAAAPKTATPRKVATSGAKVAVQKSTTNRKSS